MSNGNWERLQEKLGEEGFGSVCHGSGRKLDSFRDAHSTVQVSGTVYGQLDKIELNDDPFGDLPDRFVSSIFIAEVDGKEYLVNTEGFGYCRYIAKVEVV